jgi:hypothetical protein
VNVEVQLYSVDKLSNSYARSWFNPLSISWEWVMKKRALEPDNNWMQLISMRIKVPISSLDVSSLLEDSVAQFIVM